MKNYVPTPGMRTNFLSRTEGGETVTVIMDGYTIEYTNIKNVEAYIRAAIAKNPAITGWICNGKTTMI